MSESPTTAVPGARRPAEAEPAPDPVTAVDLDAAVRKIPALNVDLRLSRVEVFHTLAVDLAELVKDPIRDWRILHRARAADTFFQPLRAALTDQLAGAYDESERHIRTRMREAVRLHGKAVWTEQFLARFAPIGLPVPPSLWHNHHLIGPDRRLSDNPASPLHYVRLKDIDLKMFPDGTITYTVRTTFDDRPDGARRAEPVEPASVKAAIVRLDKVDRLLTENFRTALVTLLRQSRFRQVVADHIRYNGAPGRALSLLETVDLDSIHLRRIAREHRAVFVERFYDGAAIRRAIDRGETSFDAARLELRTVLSSAALAGLLNMAGWYERYNARYVAQLAEREVGYRDDEIYLTESKATIVSAAGFWRDEGADGTPADPLTRYKWDIVLAVEYHVARLAYLASTLSYYQNHPDVQGLEEKDALRALDHVIDGRSILSHIEESLDLSLSVDHGFTRLFIARLREELGIEEVLGSIRARVADASTSVGLRSAVLSAENTSKKSLRATVASLDLAVENNRLQRTLKFWAILAVVMTVLLFAAGALLQWAQRPRPDVYLCTTDDPAPEAACQRIVLPDPPADR